MSSKSRGARRAGAWERVSIGVYSRRRIPNRRAGAGHPARLRIVVFHLASQGHRHGTDDKRPDTSGVSCLGGIRSLRPRPRRSAAGFRRGARQPAAPAQCRADLHGRHGLCRSRLLRSNRVRDPRHRPPGLRRAEVHRLLCLPGCLQRVAGGAADGLLLGAGRDPGCADALGDHWSRVNGGDNRRPAQAARLCHGLFRKVAPRPSPPVPAASTRLRRVRRPAVLQRHVAGGVRRQTRHPGSQSRLSAAAVDPGQRSGWGDPNARRPGYVDRSLHRARSELHRPEQEPPFLSLPPPLHGPYPAWRLAVIPGPEPEGPLRRRHDGNRRFGGTPSRTAGSPRPGERHAGHLSERQRALAELRQLTQDLPARCGRGKARCSRVGRACRA